MENEKLFDELFNYKRSELEKFENQNILKNGSVSEKEELSKKLQKESQKQNKKNQQLET